MLPESGQPVVLEKFELYSTKSHYYLVGHDKASTAFRLLKLSRLEAELEASADPCTYTKAECTALLRRIRDGNIRIGGLQSVCKVRSLTSLCFRKGDQQESVVQGLHCTHSGWHTSTANVTSSLGQAAAK